jgi:hypothetical protein
MAFLQTVNKRIKPLYLVEEDILESCNILPLKSNIITDNNNTNNNKNNNMSGGCSSQELDQLTGSGSKTSEHVRDILADPFTDPYEKQVYHLDIAMRNILSNDKLPVRDKLLSYLRTIKNYLYFRDRLESKAKTESLFSVPKKKKKKKREEEILTFGPSKTVEKTDVGDVPTKEPEGRMSDGQPVGKRKRFDPDAAETNGKETRLFSHGNMTKSLHSKIRPRFNKLLNELKDKDTFDWDRDTGLIYINDSVISESNIQALALYKIGEDLGDPQPDPPKGYQHFKNYLESEKISSGRVLREHPGAAVPVAELKRKGVLKRGKVELKGSGYYLTY